MADKSNTPNAGRAPEADQPGRIRNVVLVGHTGAGKTTLVESLLLATGNLTRLGRVEDGTTVSDFDEAEIRQQRSVNLSLEPLVVNEPDGPIKINLLDTPGYADYVGDLRAGLRAADAALFIISAAEDIDGTTKMLWDECAAVGMPRAVVVTKLDNGRTNFDGVIAMCQDAFGDNVLPAYLPQLGADGVQTGLVGLLSQCVYDYSSGTRSESKASEELRMEIEDARNTFIEGIIAESEDETLMDRYLGGEDIDLKVFIDDLETAVARGSFYPVLPVNPMNGVGVTELLEVMTQAFPSPLEHPVPTVTTIDGQPGPALTCDPNGPLVAEVVKTTSDPYVGKISLVRIFSGTIHADQTVHVSGHFLADRGHDDHDIDEKIGALTCPLGKTQRAIQSAVAGDVVAVAKLTKAETGDTLSSKEQPLLMQPWTMPEPLLPVAVVAKSKADEDKLSQGLNRLLAEDPTLRLEHNTDTHQLVLWCMGEAHLDVLMDRLTNRYGVAVDSVPLKVSLRETFASKGEGHGRHVKQSGGHGQYAVCDITVEPLPSGSGFEFVDKVVGGAVPRQFIPSVEKGVRTQMERGVIAGYPVQDIRVTLHDGKAHSVDSSDMAFQTAGALALKDAAEKAQVTLLEPVDEVAVLVADDYVGAIMGDFSTRRGRVLGSEPVGSSGRTKILAEVPQIEICRYAIDLRSLSHGTGTFSRKYVRHEPMPSHIAEKVRAAE
ncbi:elongation factor G-like protein EF-G2 [Sporichthya brevicatena]|uniref:Elongation factor G-like protein EF-G2 n=1 Tax=Sporichthya brevicatena TaxID=171442 RepID=A0ABN1H127_9ACTN